MITSTTCLDTALELLHCYHLWPVVIHPPGVKLEDRITTGKEPVGTAWGLKRPTEQSIRVTFRSNPGAGVGLRLGPESGIFDIECDGPEGEDSYIKLMGGEIIATLGWSSRRGPHHVFRYDARLAAYGKSIIKLPELPGLEIRIGENGKQLQSNCPPTIGEDGKPREWNDCSIIADPPEAMFSFLDAAMEREAIRLEVTNHHAHGNAMTMEDHCRSYLAKVELGVQGQNGSTPMMRAAGVICRFGIMDEPGGWRIGFQLLSEYGSKCNPPWRNEKQIEHKLNDAFRLEKRRDLRTQWSGHGNSSQANSLPPSADKPSVEVKPVGATGIEDDDSVPIKLTPWPEPPDKAAYHGLLGAIVRKIEPHTEAAPLALLANMVVFFGNVIGRTAYIQVEATRHYLNEFAITVGRSAMGRKGTATDWGKHVFSAVDGLWTSDRIQAGLSSGEGLISAVRDPVETRSPIRQKGKVIDWQMVTTDTGVADKRLLVAETEFGGALRALEREGNKLSSIIRLAWDSGNLKTLTKIPHKASDAHVSIVGHITIDELRLLLSQVDIVNGFANRFLWFAVRRQRPLPFGGAPLDMQSGSDALVLAIEHARTVSRITWSDGARELWPAMYDKLAELPLGSLAEVLSRGQPHVLRLAGIYTLADGLACIEECHLLAAKALWDASAQCARYIFRDSLGDPNAEKIMSALMEAAPEGLTRTEISIRVFKRNLASVKIKALIATLIESGAVREVKEVTSGAPLHRYFTA